MDSRFWKNSSFRGGRRSKACSKMPEASVTRSPTWAVDDGRTDFPGLTCGSQLRPEKMGSNRSPVSSPSRNFRSQPETTFPNMNPITCCMFVFFNMLEQPSLFRFCLGRDTETVVGTTPQARHRWDRVGLLRFGFDGLARSSRQEAQSFGVPSRGSDPKKGVFDSYQLG